MDSPPKRMTRARAAAKASESSTRTTKIVTAAARARTTATASTKSTAAKRKNRAEEDDNSDLDDEDVYMRRTVRGRPKKIPEPQSESAGAMPAKSSRGRPAKRAVAETSVDDEAPVKATRGRTRKDTVPQASEDVTERKTTARSRATTLTRAAPSTSKPTTKKTVKFEEPDKENIEPSQNDKEQSSSSSLRARPARKGTTTTGTRNTKTTSKASSSEKKPLSPKKVTQMPFSRDESEDELAGDDCMLSKQMSKNPVKPPKATVARSKRPEKAPVDNKSETVATSKADKPASDMGVMGSPPKRPPVSPVRESMKSPAKRMGHLPFPESAMKTGGQSNEQSAQTPGFKASLLQSAAKRPLSPVKGLIFPSSGKPQSNLKGSSAQKPMFQSPAKRAIPGFKPLSESRQEGESGNDGSPMMKPIVASAPVPTSSSRPSYKLMFEDHHEGDNAEHEEDAYDVPIDAPRFSSRLSAILPRSVDPDFEILEDDEEQWDLVPVEPQVEDQTETVVETAQICENKENDTVVALPDEMQGPMGLEEIVPEMEESTELLQSVAVSSEPPGQPENPMFQLRESELQSRSLDSDSESDDEHGPSNSHVEATPTPASRVSGLGLSRSARRSTLGFTSLAEQFGAWQATSPVEAASVEALNKSEETEVVEGKLGQVALATENQASPMKNEFFDNEMLAHANSQPQQQGAPCSIDTDDVEFDEVMVTGEDIALAQEANDMSLMEDEQGCDSRSGIVDDVSEASQDYGDENEVPIDPALQNARIIPVTPLRPVDRSFHTTTKVPLKPADHSTPSPLKKRSFSASRVAPRRPHGVSRSASVISYSPMKHKRKSSIGSKRRRRSSSSSIAPTTPAKSETWSSMGTPARTPRQDMNPALLRGAVVFVDVHTSEGADASGIFVELLGQMGARCVKSWSWNPSSPSSREASTKIGITHVVYKDGGKRTMEKVRETNGVVQCVGVSWVLDCERENKWLDEAPYYIDTALVPRGGARRRKSMEPQALANMNGTLVRSPSKGGPSTPMNRRQSTVWMHTPSDQGEDEQDDVEWSKFILTPVPKTPAPEAVARFAAELPETPSDGNMGEDSPSKQALLMQTCPPKKPYQDMGEGVLRAEKDEQVLMRLMAARRKSLQFAPKIGSPLSKTWGL